jgi:hypothetical protein
MLDLHIDSLFYQGTNKELPHKVVANTADEDDTCSFASGGAGEIPG